MELEIIGRSQSGSVLVKFNNRHYLVNLTGGFAYIVAEENVAGYSNVGYLETQQAADRAKVEKIITDPRCLFDT